MMQDLSAKRSSRRLLVAFAVAISLIFWTIYHNRCTDDCYKSTPFVDGRAGDEEGRRKSAERNTIKTLSTMIKHCPRSSRYIVTWSYDGEDPLGGYVAGKTVFDRKRAMLRETYWEDPPSAAYTNLAKVSVADIHAVAGISGDISVLKRQMNHKPPTLSRHSTAN